MQNKAPVQTAAHPTRYQTGDGIRRCQPLLPKSKSQKKANIVNAPARLYPIDRQLNKDHFNALYGALKNQILLQ